MLPLERKCQSFPVRVSPLLSLGLDDFPGLMGQALADLEQLVILICRPQRPLSATSLRTCTMPFLWALLGLVRWKLSYLAAPSPTLKTTTGSVDPP